MVPTMHQPRKALKAATDRPEALQLLQVPKAFRQANRPEQGGFKYSMVELKLPSPHVSLSNSKPLKLLRFCFKAVLHGIEFRVISGALRHRRRSDNLDVAQGGRATC
jgi:hypothetical protein